MEGQREEEEGVEKDEDEAGASQFQMPPHGLQTHAAHVPQFNCLGPSPSRINTLIAGRSSSIQIWLGEESVEEQQVSKGNLLNSKARGLDSVANTEVKRHISS